ncbi:platelet endothelial aggregation receptor 1-like isoform X2 [Haliotis rubra]|nr:platelet endothelial aggregation receptor 1-like isoform X2 [Haliotis rubra]
MLSLAVILLSHCMSTVVYTSTVCPNCDNNGTCVDSRFYGTHCDLECPDTCLNSRCQMNNTRVVCTEGCVAGRRGGDCGLNCPTACKQCERYGDSCTGLCRNARYYGPNCSKLCPSHCNLKDGCTTIKGYCNGCEAGYRGRYCNHSCPDNCERCDQYGEGCLKCTERYCLGLCDENMTNCDSTSCKKTCLPNCRSFDIGRSQCTGPCINQNYHGAMCSISCPPKCDTCHKQTGKCMQCVPRMWGRSCNESCNQNCKVCDRYSGQCIGLCSNSNFHGDYCATPCPVNCHGCHRETGLCIECATNFSRKYCDEICSPCAGQTCNTSPCQKRNADHTLVIVMGTIAGASTLLLLVLGFWAHKRNRLMCVSSSNTGGGRWDSNGSRQSRNSDYQSHKYSEIYDKDLDTDSCLPGPSPPRLSVQPPLPPLHPKHDPRQESPKPRSWSLGQGTSRDFRSSFVSAHKDSHMTSGNEPSLVTSEMSGVSNIASSPIKDLARSPSMPVLMTTDVASGSTHQYIPHSCDIHDRPVSSSTLGLPTKTSSILFIEQNNDLSNITVKYITPDETVQGK